MRRKGSAGGIDGRDIKAFDQEAERYLSGLKSDLERGTYTPEPYYSIAVPKSVGSREKRRLGLPTIRDKVAQQAVRNAIEPIFEKVFLDVSYGYRPSKGAARAIRRVRHMIRTEKRVWVTICDIDKFFDTINIDVLFEKIKEKIWEPEILNLLKLWVCIGHVDADGNWMDRKMGVAQGGIISPLLSNIYLHSFDKYMVEHEYGLVRYSDDFIILSHNEVDARNALRDARQYLTEKLLLRLNPNPAVRNVKKGFVYMGFFFQGEHLKIDNAKFMRIKNKLKFICKAHLNKPLPEFIRKMNSEVKGLKNYYKPLAPEYQINALDEYMKLQTSIFLLRKKTSGELPAKEKVLTTLMALEPLKNRTHTETKRFINEIIDFAWKGAKRRSGRGDNAHKPESRSSGDEKRSSTHVDAERKIKRKKREYYKKRILTGNLVVSTPRCLIGRKRGRIIFKQGRKIIKEIAVTKVDHISITAYGVSLTSGLIQLCVENRIPIDFFNYKGEPTAKLYLPVLPDTSVGIAQLQAFYNGKSYEIAASIVEGKINNQINILKYFLKYRRRIDKEFSQQCELAVEKMESIMGSVADIERSKDYDLFRGRLMAAEGRSSSYYWNMVGILLEDDVDFVKRERQGAKDIVNCCLNYGYSMLYPRIWQALIQAGLNPMISYLHKEQPGTPTLTFDLIEEFRHHVVDRTVFSLFTRGKDMRLSQGELSSSTKKIIINEILGRLKTETRFRKHRMSIETIIFHQAKALADYLAGKKRMYNPFVGRY
ncbi:MAG: CRISPR-associated endonuclease Cas1 [Deferribacteres bacterium]|nr:CRISPR-associated endonuclease Cas1 [Deferribacteres bacterium]